MVKTPKEKKLKTFDRNESSDILIGMMKTALQQNEEKGINPQGLPKMLVSSKSMWHKSYNNQFNDKSIERSGGRS